MSAEENQEIGYFLIQQLKLLNTKPKQRRFSSDSLIMAFSLHFKSPNVYEFLFFNSSKCKTIKKIVW